MNLIDRYVTEVGKHLPRKNRLDIETELRSTLEDMLEDRSQQTGRPADEALATELLQEYGPPHKVAASYQTHPYLIGPRMFPTYTLVLKIVFFAVTLGLSIATIVSLISSDMTSPEQLQAWVDFSTGLVSALLVAFGNVTLVFAILERVLPVSEFEDKEKWTPAELTKEPGTNQVKTGDRIASIIFTVAGLMVLNFYPQIFSIWMIENGEFIPLVTLSEAFFRFLPWINLSGILTIALDFWLLRRETWNTATRLAHIGLQFFSIGIVIGLLRTPDLLTFIPGATDLDGGRILVQIFSRMIPVALMIAVIVNTVEIVKDILQLVRSGKVVNPFEKSL